MRKIRKILRLIRLWPVRRWLKSKLIPYKIFRTGNLNVSADSVATSFDPKTKCGSVLFYFGDISENRVLSVELSERSFESLANLMALPFRGESQ
jgi:hypothetical protein